jgi:hypothetical protein
MSTFAFDPVNPFLHICHNFARYKSNGIGVIPPMRNGRSLRKYQRHIDLSTKKKSHLACYSNRRTINIFL